MIMKKKKIFIGLTILVLGLLVILAIYVSSVNNPSDPIGTETLNHGTQMRYGDISIALSGVNKDSAGMSFHNNKTDESSNKQVKAGDTVNIYGYSIKINSLKEATNPSTAPGSSQGYVKFIINKQK